MELDEALAQISAIRTQIARTETFRGYRAGTVALTALLAFCGAAVQAVWIPRPSEDLRGYLMLWVGIAGISLAAHGLELAYRWYRATSSLTRHATLVAVGQFSPCVVAGGLVTCPVGWFAQPSAWMLPGLWSILFGLGVLASCQVLPRPVLAAGAYYLVSGFACLVLARGAAALSPWAMAGTFGLGQLLVAAILYFALERTHGHP